MTVSGTELVPDEDLAQAMARVAEDAVPSAAACLALAKLYLRRGNTRAGAQWAFAACDSTDDFASWTSAARIVKRCGPFSGRPLRAARVAVLGSYTTSQLTSLLP